MVQPLPVVIFVDRELAWTEPLRGELQRRGARVFAAESMRELQEMTARAVPDVAVIGEHWPAGGVEQIIRHMREANREILLVVLSAEKPPPVSDAPGILYQARAPAEPRALLDVITGSLRGRLREPNERPRRPAVIMCVDDDPLYLRSLDRLLTHHGYSVASFADPDRALEAVPEVRPDLAIIDIMMPGMNGLNLADEIREGYGGRVPVVMLTARGSDEDILDGYRHGIAYYITKPCAPTMVLNVVDYLVGGLDRAARERLESQL
ncbi:MAG: response regulator [Planctomycetes bacterium]|nr:response regulator [Planctomycetota bacterium]